MTPAAPGGGGLAAWATLWSEVEPLVDEALSLPPAERQAWRQALDSRCRPELRTAVLALLDAASAAIETGFLAGLPALPAAAQALEEAPAGDPAAPGARVGPWQLLRPLGEGGMGSVWLAERADGTLRRPVALKLPRLAWAGGLAERLARERDILAGLTHPNIARLYDAGVDAAGRPWLALEHVDGQPIDAHAQAAGLGVRARVQLLLQVCEAVAHAHRNLVIHRDLKPGNILVTPQGEVKLLDFGIAKLIDGDRAAPTALTELAGRALTLDYASPEQVRGEPLTTASDVYSLGVVAYELLAGCKPYRLQRGSAAELEQAVAQADIAPASRRAAEPATARALRGDLDAILAQALRADPADRYPGVDALRADLQRHLDGDAVLARPPALGYRLGRLLRRHRLPVASAAAVAAALLAGSALAWWQAVAAREAALRADAEARAARQAQAEATASRQLAEQQAALAESRRAEAESATARAAAAAALAGSEAERARNAASAEQRSAEEARQQARRAEEVKQFALSLFEQADTQAGAGAQTTARELLLKARERIERDLAGAPAIRQELQLSLARSLQSLSDQAAALALTDAVLAAAPAEPLHTEAQLLRAELLTGQGRFDDALALCEQLEQRTRGRRDMLRLSVLRLLSVQLARADRYVEAVSRAEEAVALGEGPPALPPLGRLRAWMALANNRYIGRLPGASTAADRAVALAAQLYEDPRAEPRLEAQQMRAQALMGEGRLADSVSQYGELLAARRAQLGDRDFGLAAIYNGMGNAQLQLGQFEAALASYRALTAVVDHNERGPTVNRALGRYRTGTALLALDRDAEAEAALAEAVAVRLAAGGGPGTVVGWRLAQATALARLGRHAEADALVRESENAQPGDAFDTALWAGQRAAVRLVQDRPAEALAQADVALPVFAAQANRTQWQRMQALRGRALLALGQPEPALQAAREAVPGAAPADDATRSTDQADALLTQARALLVLERPAEAQAASTRALQTWTLRRPGSRGHGLALGWHALALRAGGDCAGAERHAAQALAQVGAAVTAAERELREQLGALVAGRCAVASR